MSCPECEEMRRRIEYGRAAHNEDRAARDWLARENERLRKAAQAVVDFSTPVEMPAGAYVVDRGHVDALREALRSAT